MRLLAAPLSYTETGFVDTPVTFAGETYTALAPTEATYQFNSWRATYRYRFWTGERWRFLLDLDALGGGPGRAEDLSLQLGYDINERWGLAFGYRTVEGGVSVDDVYDFAWFNYGVVSGSYRWGGQ